MVSYLGKSGASCEEGEEMFSAEFRSSSVIVALTTSVLTNHPAENKDKDDKDIYCRLKPKKC